MAASNDKARTKSRLSSFLTMLLAISTVLSFFALLLRHGHLRAESLIETILQLINIPVGGTPVAVVVSTLLWFGLVNRKKLALWVVMGLQIAGILIALLGIHAAVLSSPNSTALWMRVGSSLLSIFAAVAMFAVLFWLRDQFPAKLIISSWPWSIAILLVGISITIGITHLLLVNSSSFTQIDEGHSLLLAVAHSIGIDEIGRIHLPFGARWIPTITSYGLAITLITTVAVLLRPARSADSWSPSQEITLRKMLNINPGDSLGYFNTRRDKLAHFSPYRGSAVVYAVSNGCCIASGDPLGPESAWPNAIKAWQEFAHSYGWSCAVLGASERAARAYATAGMRAISMGDEAILYPSQFSLDSTTFTRLRRTVNKLKKQNIEVRILRQSELSDEDLVKVISQADQWRQGGIERGFSMASGRIGDPSDSRNMIVIAQQIHDDETTTWHGLLIFTPWGANGLSLDVMRRSPEAPNGITDLMVAELLTRGQELGIARVSLNFAFLRQVFVSGETFGSSSLTRFNSKLLGSLDRFFQLESLYRANEKYRPEWTPRYLCFDPGRSLLRIAFASAYLEGFIPRVTKESLVDSQPTPHFLDAIKKLDNEALKALTPPTRKLTDQEQQRNRHLQSLPEGNGYPLGIEPALSVAELLNLPWIGQEVRFVGRVNSRRLHGGVVFVDILDGDEKVQVIAEVSRTPREELRSFARLLDAGDLVVVVGRQGYSKTGTPSILLESWQVVAKALRPVPFGGLVRRNQRQRTLDLLVHPEKVQLLKSRSRIVAQLRETLTRRGYLEVETPILNVVHGGATARPFHTFINAYRMNLSLRIAPELQLKKLVVAGMGAVFEIGRNFRNEGADNTHNPEFTSLEAYQPFGDYNTMRELAREMILDVATSHFGRPVLPLKHGEKTALIDVSGEWPCIDVCQAVSAAVDAEITIETPLDQLLEIASKFEIPVRDRMGAGAVIEELYSELVEPNTVFPTFYQDFPAETSPLTAPHRSKPGLVERWDLVIGGMELGTAYSELANPIIQRERLTEQSLKAVAGDSEAMALDEDFLAALELGMPPTGGLGMGVDRLVMVLTRANIRDVLTFPFVKPER